MGALRYARAVYGGFKEYGRQANQANMDAEHNLSRTFGGSSTEADAMRVADETSRLMKERGVSLRASIRKRLNLQ